MQSKKPAIYFLALGVAMIIVDSTIVNVAMPTIVKKLGITSGQAQWVQGIYTLVFASTLLMFGRLADQFGRRRLFLLGNIIFGIFSVAAALANSASILIRDRALQGIGAAMILPTSLSIINASFNLTDRRKALAIWGSVIGGSAALGPFIGGYLITSFTWRWAFGLNLPIVLVVIWGVLRSVTESEKGVKQDFDLIGSALVLIGFASFVCALIEGRNFGWTSLTILGCFAGAATAITVFLLLERYRSKNSRATYMDLDILRIRSFRSAVTTSLIVSLGEYGLLFLLPYWLQNVLGYSGLKTGSLFLVLALGSFVASSAGRHAFGKRTAIEILQIGVTLEVVGVSFLGLVISPSSNVIFIILSLFIYGMGIGLATTQITSIALQDVPTEKSGQASGMSSTMRQMGFGLGVAGLGSLLFGLLGSDVNHRLAVQGLLSSDARNALVHQVVTSAGTVIPKLHGEQAQAAIGALTSASKWSSLVATIFLCFGWLAVNSLRRSSKKQPGLQLS
jgi:EmrB/QacA subfamily drug resistance transporter